MGDDLTATSYLTSSSAAAGPDQADHAALALVTDDLAEQALAVAAAEASGSVGKTHRWVAARWPAWKCVAWRCGAHIQAHQPPLPGESRCPAWTRCMSPVSRHANPLVRPLPHRYASARLDRPSVVASRPTNPLVRPHLPHCATRQGEEARGGVEGGGRGYCFPRHGMARTSRARGRAALPPLGRCPI